MDIRAHLIKAVLMFYAGGFHFTIKPAADADP